MTTQSAAMLDPAPAVLMYKNAIAPYNNDPDLQPTLTNRNTDKRDSCAAALKILEQLIELAAYQTAEPIAKRHRPQRNNKAQPLQPRHHQTTELKQTLRHRTTALTESNEHAIDSYNEFDAY